MSDLYSINTKKCGICASFGKNDRLHWHQDPESGEIWVWCQGACKRGYSLYEYCAKAGLSVREFLKNDFSFEESRSNEVNSMVWPAYFLPLFDPRAKKGLEYIKSRGLDPNTGDMYYDVEDECIVLPYYFDKVFVGAQMRYIEPWVDKDGETRKIDTLPGTRLGLLVYNWNQQPIPNGIKAVIVCEGAFNALSLQQTLNRVYGGSVNNPYRCIATSGCNMSEHHADLLKELMNQGKKIILGYDYDEAGLKGIQRAIKRQAITHIANTGIDNTDWNDLLKQLGELELAKFFFKRIQPIEY
jgi:5S rRNA maturation endonuclease (ribonuclease M5)